LALRARSFKMRGLATDIPDQTCKTAPQSRTRFLGHRQLPWIQFERSCSILFFGRLRNAFAAPCLMRAKLALALDHFRCKFEIRLAADAFEVVDKYRLAVGRRLGNTHIARDHGVVHLAPHELPNVGYNLVG